MTSQAPSLSAEMQQPSRYGLRPPPGDSNSQRRAQASIASSRSRASSSIQSSLPPPSESMMMYGAAAPEQSYIHRTISGTSSITASDYDSCVYSASSVESSGTGNSQYFDQRGAFPTAEQDTMPYDYTHNGTLQPAKVLANMPTARRAYPPPRTPTMMMPVDAPTSTSSHKNNLLPEDVSPIAAVVSPESFQDPSFTMPGMPQQGRALHLIPQSPSDAEEEDDENYEDEEEDAHYFHPQQQPILQHSRNLHDGMSPAMMLESPSDYYYPSECSKSQARTCSTLPQSFMDTPPSFSTSNILLNNTTTSTTGPSPRHYPHQDEDWRIHGRAYRAELIRQDEQNGRHQFEMSDDCSIRRYHLVAEKVLAQFLDTRDDPNVNLRDTYLVGTRLSKFLSTVLPSHKDFNSTDPELSELRRQCNERWLRLNHYLEELALIIDEEEHNQFVLRDLNKLRGGEHSNYSLGISIGESPATMPSTIETTPRKSKNSSARSTPSPPSKSLHSHHEDPSVDVPTLDPLNDTGSTSNQAILLAPNHDSHPVLSTEASSIGSSNNIGAGDKYSSRRNLDQQINAAAIDDDALPVSENAEHPTTTEDAGTVVSLDTHWFSSGPFPPSEEKNEETKIEEDDDKIFELDENEQIVQITGSNSRRPRPDHKDIEFSNLSFDEEGQLVDFFATGDMAKLKEAMGIKNATQSAFEKQDKDTSTATQTENERSAANKPASWRIAPYPSTKTHRQEGALGVESSKETPASDKPAKTPLGLEAIKQKYSSLQCFDRRESSSLKPSAEKRVSWVEPENDERSSASNPSNPNATEEMSSWWDSPGDGDKDVLASAKKPPGKKQNESQHSMASSRSSARIMCSRYVALDEHEAREKQSSKRKQVAPANLKAPPKAPSTVAEEDWEQSELRPIRRDEDSDADFAEISAVLDENKARAKEMKPYRHRGIYHLKECVRCLLE